jgi:p-aminobenzoyl-glutamate transporter AbgT
MLAMQTSKFMVGQYVWTSTVLTTFIDVLDLHRCGQIVAIEGAILLVRMVNSEHIVRVPANTCSAVTNLKALVTIAKLESGE